MNRTITCRINGKERVLTVDVRQSLLEVLREHLGLTGVKQGCAVGECGACTVLVDDEPIDSCIYLAVWAEGKAVRTVEGEVKNGEMSPIQKAYVEEGAVQCGFCTPGFIMTSTAFIEKHKGSKVSSKEIRVEHSGNLCRCTGYLTIVDAVEKCLDSSGLPDNESPADHD